MNKDGKRHPEMGVTKKVNLWSFGMKDHIGDNKDSGLIHSDVATVTNDYALSTQRLSCSIPTRGWFTSMLGTNVSPNEPIF